MVCHQHGQSLALSLGCSLDKVNLSLTDEESTGPREIICKSRASSMCSKRKEGRRAEIFRGSWSKPGEQPGVLMLRQEKGRLLFG